MTRRPVPSLPNASALAAAMVAAATLTTATPARAHPHVYVTMTSELIYAPDGSVTGVRQVWTFDDMYSAFATQGLGSKTKGVFTREDLAPLAAENATALKEFDFFTFAKLDGQKIEFTDAVDYSAEFKDSLLTLYFTLPIKTPAKARTVDLEVYDPTYFVDFSFSKDSPLVLKGAPSGCEFALNKAQDAEVGAKIKSLGEAAFAGPDASYGAMFANKAKVKCP